MPRNQILLQVFVASPGDLAPEREIVAQTIAELNSLWAGKLGIGLELVRWESHAYPGFAADAQDVINAEIPQENDIFIGIMWARFGTPTGRAGSGTSEEFETALRRYRADGTPHLMMYFKQAPLPLSEIDPEQLRRVNEFRAHVRREGALD
jgi:hypothetical protein